MPARFIPRAVSLACKDISSFPTTLPCPEAKCLGLSAPVIAWHTERDRIAEVGGFFAPLTGTCAKVVTDAKLLMQTEVAELSEPLHDLERGPSSTMPQKRNPNSCAYITATAASVRSHCSELQEAMVADHERGPWAIECRVQILMYSTLKHMADWVGRAPGQSDGEEAERHEKWHYPGVHDTADRRQSRVA